jgi:hypothetical protein
VGDQVLLKVSPTKGIVCFGATEKLSPRYIGPFVIIARVGSHLSLAVAQFHERSTQCIPCIYVEKVFARSRA